MFVAKPIEVAIDVPSGYLVFADDLRFAFSVPEERGNPQNAEGPLWQKLITRAYGDAGLFHGFVGNSCPSIHRYQDELIIGNPSYDDDTWETNDDLPGEQVGNIITDLWWYSLTDKDNLKHLLRQRNKDIQDINLDGTVEVEPGRYILRHYYPHFGKSDIPHNDGVKIFATLERSDREIEDQKLPDEGIADMLMRNPLGEITYACVESDRDKYDEINKDQSLIFEYYEIFTHWELDEFGDLFTRPKFTAEELQDHSIVRRRSIEHRTKSMEKHLQNKRRMENLKNDLSSEEAGRTVEEILESLKDY